ncbi:MAG: DUF6916 family protein [Pyrinomonadaceae bacterium]
MAERLEHAAFLENLNSTFRLHLDGSDKVDLELMEVSELKTARRQEMFSLVFRCASSTVFPQRIYGLAHEDMGQFDLFLVPIKKDDQGVYYETVFNRLFENSESSGTVS